jgi:hypothetical protein
MEAAVAAIGKQWARQDRKRRRDAAAARADGAAARADGAASTSASTSTASDVAAEQAEPAVAGVHPALLTAAVQKRLHESVRGLIDDGGDRALKAGAAFVSRSVYAVFMTIQAIHPLPHGPQWASLLYICYHAVSMEFSGTAYPLQRASPPEGLATREMRLLVRKLGMLPEAGGEDEALMKAARTWERASDAELSDAIKTVWKLVSGVPSIAMAFASLLWPCQRAHLLFDHGGNPR